MLPNLTIRSERPADIPVISAITREAFRTHPHSHQTEEFIIQALRKAGALAVSLVAEVDAEVVGHVTFARVEISDGTSDWYGLGPIAVKPERQGSGIGRALIENGLEALWQLGARGCVLVGEPALYERFGFRNRKGLVLDSVPQEYFLALPFGDEIPAGRVSCHEAFDATG
jgi:putative acetyltransferase